MNFDVEMLVRIVAAVAAIALVASPYLVAAWGKAKAWYTRRATPQADSSLKDMTTVLEIANRLRLRGCEPGVDLCEKLLSVMLDASPPKE